MPNISHVYPFSPRPPMLDSTRRRKPPSVLKLAAAYQKQIPRTYKKYVIPKHPLDKCSEQCQCCSNFGIGSLQTAPARPFMSTSRYSENVSVSISCIPNREIYFTGHCACNYHTDLPPFSNDNFIDHDTKVGWSPTSWQLKTSTSTTDSDEGSPIAKPPRCSRTKKYYPM